MAHVIANHRPTAIAGRSLLNSLFTAFGTWRQRRHLATLDAHLRRDLGLSEADILREASRPVWDVPQSWRQIG